MTFNTRHLPWGGLVLGWSVGHLRRLVRLAALGWSDRLAHVGISVFAETVVARRRRHMLLLAFVLPVARMHRQQAPYISNTIGADFMGPEGLEPPPNILAQGLIQPTSPPNNSHAKLQSMIIKRSQNLGKKRKLLISGEIWKSPLFLALYWPWTSDSRKSRQKMVKKHGKLLWKSPKSRQRHDIKWSNFMHFLCHRTRFIAPQKYTQK